MRESGARPSLEALDELALTQTAETLTIIDKTGRQRVLRLGGRKTRDESAPGGPEELKAKWSKDGSLVVYVKPKEGPKRTETYMISNDRKRLFLTLSLEGRGPGIKLRRVYDAVPPEPAVEEPASEPQGLQSCRPTTRTVLVVGSSSADFCRPMS